METGTGRLTFKADNSGALLGQGTHNCIITEVVESLPQSGEFEDPTPQLKTVFKCITTGKIFSEWYNTRGYVRFKELSEVDKNSNRFTAKDGYAIDKTTGHRLIDSKRTEQALGIINKLGADAGIPLKTEFTEDDLIGRQVAIVIGPDERMNLRVKSTRKVTQMAEAGF